ncbi:Gfo/Idh/MocA family protein [Thermoactinomyces sp. CICC 10521]|uniref:Gfo/Idh/MocA family protein n=1 Tax=Thermoactinomyces sp. CICC 10521 TaxID=2767426 RepID=UPI0018DE45CB|nr:Gfo/Idh/MocA family oxidoreductase [Thermoactinomyces sp. CICC 10521]MBH8607520.1 Gfo/Idh/MocA family oxidoreductase [Thermoactinomyces sp. CICC 10521]
MPEIKIGIIGLDTSHVTAFTQLLNDPDHPHHVPGGRVVAAFPGGTPDFELSFSRVGGYTRQLRDQFGVRITATPEATAEQCDAILLESVDGRVHLQQFKKIVPFGKPVFIDKPLALNSADARAMLELAAEHRVPLMSCSALRYAEALTTALADGGQEAVFGADCYGPMPLEPTQPGLFWYGIHPVEMLFAILGKGCLDVTAISNDGQEMAVGLWKDGRIGTVRGNRKGNNGFGALLHRQTGTQYVDVNSGAKPYYASLLERIMEMFVTGKPPVDPEETWQIIRFIEAVNESRQTGRKVSL